MCVWTSLIPSLPYCTLRAREPGSWNNTWYLSVRERYWRDRNEVYLFVRWQAKGQQSRESTHSLQYGIYLYQLTYKAHFLFKQRLPFADVALHVNTLCTWFCILHGHFPPLACDIESWEWAWGQGCVRTALEIIFSTIIRNTAGLSASLLETIKVVTCTCSTMSSSYMYKLCV